MVGVVRGGGGKESLSLPFLLFPAILEKYRRGEERKFFRRHFCLPLLLLYCTGGENRAWVRV